MSGFFGSISKHDCFANVFYGTNYHSHLGTKRAGLAFYSEKKLIPNKSIIKDTRGIFLEDSIVRGTQLKDNVQDLYRAGIRKVHMRIACPSLTYPCEFLNFSRSQSNLDLATHKTVEQ